MKLTIPFVIPLVLFIILACNNDPSDSENEIHAINLPDSLSARRIEFVLELRELVAEQQWPVFADKLAEGVLVYYNDDRSEIFFPDEKVKQKLTDVVYHNEFYALAPRIDTFPYHLENMISFDIADIGKIYFEHPVEQYFAGSMALSKSWMLIVMCSVLLLVERKAIYRSSTGNGSGNYNNRD